MKKPIVKVDRWFYRANSFKVSCCKLETFVDPQNNFCVLVTERGDNTGPSVTNSHKSLRLAIESELGLEGKEYWFYECYDRNSYKPPRDDRNDVTKVIMIEDGNPRWKFVSDEEWDAVYIDPQRPRPKTILRKG